ncbi:3'-5' exonuclease [Taibaiella koreensis]|uniref:3'-5' exonuclease n=1 Tax=Taibaiella koreensis TaxID=1268548 RepID=UPI000E59EB4B|nr:3'-5' exonuclease [Taibaiella koreensis]
MITHKKAERVYFHKTLIIDIETVPLSYDWNLVPDTLKDHWCHKMQFLSLKEEENDPAVAFASRAGIYAEFGKIVCVGMGYIMQQSDRRVVRLKSIRNDDENALLLELKQTIEHFHQQNKDIIFCGHNIKEFDIPYICRRMLVNGIALPECLDLGGLKPWQVGHQDTLELWRFGDHKHYTGLDLMAWLLGVPLAAPEMNKTAIARMYWEQNDPEGVADHCLKQVYMASLVYLKLKGWQEEWPEPLYV